MDLRAIGDRRFSTVRVGWDQNGSVATRLPSVPIGDDGALSFGDRFYDARGFEVPLTVASWRGQLSGADALTARMALIHGLVDGARTEWEVVNATRRRE